MDSYKVELTATLKIVTIQILI
ncbi:hypothetical protein ACQ27_gp273 [Klebsiella phage K64-1]|nr:hypothetical protein ACQ27_gp273 [Klebsiella phage K64-1]